LASDIEITVQTPTSRKAKIYYVIWKSLSIGSEVEN